MTVVQLIEDGRWCILSPHWMASLGFVQLGKVSVLAHSMSSTGGGLANVVEGETIRFSADISKGIFTDCASTATGIAKEFGIQRC